MSQAPDEAASVTLTEIAKRLDRQARSVGCRLLAVLLDEKVQMFRVEGDAGAVLLDPDSPSLLDELIANGAFGDTAKDPLLSLARRAANEGIAMREQGRLVDAWRHQRLAALVAAQLGSPEGTQVTIANLAVLRNTMRDVIERGSVEAPPDAAGQDALRSAAAGLQRDAELIAKLILPVQGQQDLSDGLTLHRLACMAGDVKGALHVRQRLQAIGDSAGHTLAITAAEALAELSFDSLLLHLAGQDDASSTSVSLSGLWALYEANRHRYIDAELLKDALGALRAAYSQIEFFRLRVTAAGGAFGHEMSYRVSQMLQPVGRDLVMLLLRNDRPEEALEVIESLLSRSMTDWMGRTHGLHAVPLPFRHSMVRLTGSVNATDPVALNEIAACAKTAGPLLYLAALPIGHTAWLLRRDGVLVCFALPGMSEALQAAKGLFPSWGGRGGDGEANVTRQLGSRQTPTHKRQVRDPLLTQLYQSLWQPELERALVDQGDQLVIIADPTFNHVPWAALRSPQGRYWTQDYQIELWPSVTARLVIETGARVPSWMRARRGGPVAPLALGVSDFSHLELTIDERKVELGTLPGVEAELARVGEMIGAPQVLNTDATLARLFKDAQGADIVHIASHGLLSGERAESSVVVLGDGILSAWDLYLFDAGIRCGLVVLSACQTRLGQTHPDSLIGLANAFLVAGAQAVASTLWKVGDAAMMHLMEDFYEALTAGAAPAAALRQAQLRALATHDRDDPFCWAALVVCGRGSTYSSGDVSLTSP